MLTPSGPIHSYSGKGYLLPKDWREQRITQPVPFTELTFKAGGVPLSLNRSMTPGSHFSDPSLAFYGHHGS